MAIEVERSVQIAADAPTVWRLLVDPSSWASWWPDCLAATTQDFRNLREGSQLEVVVQPRHQKTTLRPVVDLITEERTLSLTHRGVMLQTTVTWFLHPSEAGTRLVSRGVFTGVGPFVMRLLRQDDVLLLGLHGNVRGLKKWAERLA